MLLLAKIYLSYPKLYKHKIQEYFEPVSWSKALLYYHIFNEDFRKRTREHPALNHFPKKTIRYFIEWSAYISKKSQYFHLH